LYFIKFVSLGVGLECCGFKYIGKSSQRLFAVRNDTHYYPLL